MPQPQTSHNAHLVAALIAALFALTLTASAAQAGAPVSEIVVVKHIDTATSTLHQ